MNSISLALMAIFASISLLLHAIYVFAKKGITDVPNPRSLHTENTKKSGGMIFLPLFLFFLLVAEYLSVESDQATSSLVSGFPYLIFIIYGILFFGFLGFIDDLKSLTPRRRLFFEFIFAFVWIYYLAPKISVFNYLISSSVITCISLGFLMVLIVNLVNFMDGLDLYLACTLMISSLFWGPLFSPLFIPNGPLYFIVLCLFVSLFGFVFFNVPKAKLFMGDSGSLGLGFLFLALPLLSKKVSGETFELLKLFYLFPVFWIDGILTLLIRTFQGKNVFLAHRDHLYQLLTQTRLGKAGTCLVVVLANLPAYLMYIGYLAKTITIFESEASLICSTVLFYIFIYSILRFGLQRVRKNLA